MLENAKHNRLPNDKQLNYHIIETIHNLGNQKSILGSPFEIEPFAWYDKHNTQVILLKPSQGFQSISVEDFLRTGLFQVEILEIFHSEMPNIKISFVADGSNINIKLPDLSPKNYSNIASDLSDQPSFDVQIMVLKHGVLEEVLSTGVFKVAQFAPNYSDHFFVVGTLEEAKEKLDSLYN